MTIADNSEEFTKTCVCIERKNYLESSVPIEQKDTSVVFGVLVARCRGGQAVSAKTRLNLNVYWFAIECPIIIYVAIQ